MTDEAFQDSDEELFDKTGKSVKISKVNLITYQEQWRERPFEAAATCFRGKVLKPA